MYSNFDLLIVFSFKKLTLQRLIFFYFSQKNKGLLDEMLLIIVDNPIFLRVDDLKTDYLLYFCLKFPCYVNFKILCG